MPDVIDYLNDPLLQSSEEVPKAARTPLLDRAREVIERINAFVDANGTAPRSERKRPVLERMLANELAGLCASRAQLDGLQAFDRHGLVFSAAPKPEGTGSLLSDPLLGGADDIFTVREALTLKARPDYVADRRPCPDFARFAPTFERVRGEIEAGLRRPVKFSQERIDLHEMFKLKGQLAFVADIRDEPRQDGVPDPRLRVVFDNGTESNLLMSSLSRRLYEDKSSLRIGTAEAGPLFQGASTGFVYVLRSLSPRPEVKGLLKVGTTAGTVEDRIAQARTQGAFLFAPVEIVETYALIGYSAKEVEVKLHKALTSWHVPLKVTGPEGRSVQATEWFRVDVELVAKAVYAIIGPTTRSSLER